MEIMAAHYRWDVLWGRTLGEIMRARIASGEAVRRKDGGWDMRYRASRCVKDWIDQARPESLTMFK